MTTQQVVYPYFPEKKTEAQKGEDSDVINPKKGEDFNKSSGRGKKGKRSSWFLSTVMAPGSMMQAHMLRMQLIRDQLIESWKPS